MILLNPVAVVGRIWFVCYRLPCMYRIKGLYTGKSTGYIYRMDMAAYCSHAIFMILAYGTTPLNAISWLSTPGTLRACADGNVMFPWHYDLASSGPVTFYQWQYVSKGVTVLQRQVRPNSSDILTYYDYGHDRVNLAEPTVANAGIVLKRLVKSDQGEYLVRLTGGVTDTAYLDIYTEDELEPTLVINNAAVAFGSIYNMSQCGRCAIVTSTSLGLPAHITISSSADSTPVHCQAKTTCSKVIHTSGSGSGTSRITFRLDYGFCSAKEKYIDVVWLEDNSTDQPEEGEQNDPSDKDTSGVLTLQWEFILGLSLAILGIVVIGLCVVVCLLFKWVWRKQKEDAQNLSGRQQTLLNAAIRWRSITKASNTRTILRSRSRTPKVTFDDQELGACILNTSEENNTKTEGQFPNRDAPEGTDTGNLAGDPDPTDVHVEHGHPTRGQGDGGQQPRESENGDIVNGITVDAGLEVKDASKDFNRQASSDSVLNDFVVVPSK